MSYSPCYHIGPVFNYPIGCSDAKYESDGDSNHAEADVQDVAANHDNDGAVLHSHKQRTHDDDTLMTEISGKIKLTFDDDDYLCSLIKL